jgi:hypothetical protein
MFKLNQHLLVALGCWLDFRRKSANKSLEVCVVLGAIMSLPINRRLDSAPVTYRERRQKRAERRLQVQA